MLPKYFPGVRWKLNQSAQCDFRHGLESAGHKARAALGVAKIDRVRRVRFVGRSEPDLFALLCLYILYV